MRDTSHLLEHDCIDNLVTCEVNQFLQPPSFVKEFDDKLLRKHCPMPNVSLAV